LRPRASFVPISARASLFEVLAADNAGEIGRCTHKRAVVTTERLVAGAAPRGEKA
jgi:predicted thioesterase